MRKLLMITYFAILHINLSCNPYYIVDDQEALQLKITSTKSIVSSVKEDIPIQIMIKNMYHSPVHIWKLDLKYAVGNHVLFQMIGPDGTLLYYPEGTGPFMHTKSEYEKLKPGQAITTNYLVWFGAFFARNDQDSAIKYHYPDGDYIFFAFYSRPRETSSFNFHPFKGIVKSNPCKISYKK